MESNPEQTLELALKDLSVIAQESLLSRYNLTAKEQDNKAIKKKLKKSQIEPEDTYEKALEKVQKLIDDLSKQYEISGKQYAKIRSFKKQVDASEAQREKVNKQKIMFENLFKGFKQKYEDQISKAQQIEKEEQGKRKAVIQELQERIKIIQTKYEETGKIKIQKYKQNQTLKHELSKYEPHLIAAESLADAQLKKKTIQIEIQMTTLKQKIEMMDNFKNMRVETEQKLKKSKQTEEKIGLRLLKLQKKQQEHKISLAKAHLIFEDYKKAFNVLKDVLPKKERDAALAKQKVKKSNISLQQLRKKVADLDKQQQKQINSLTVLQNLEFDLRKQLAPPPKN